MLSCRDMAPWLSTHSAPACGGKVVAPATKGGRDRRSRKVLKIDSPYGAEGCRPLSEAMQPFYTTLGAKGRRPDGCHTPLCAAGAGPYGNTGKHRPGPGPDPDRAERRLNPHARRAVVKVFIKGRLLSIKRRPPPPFEPSEPFEPGRQEAPEPSSPKGACP